MLLVPNEESSDDQSKEMIEEQSFWGGMYIFCFHPCCRGVHLFLSNMMTMNACSNTMNLTIISCYYKYQWEWQNKEIWEIMIDNDNLLFN